MTIPTDKKGGFDVFLSHNSKDKPAARALAALLSERGIKVWLDEDQLVPGQPWQSRLEEGIRGSTTGAVLVGFDGLGPWECEEMWTLLQGAVNEQKPVIPVLLPGSPDKPQLPMFLANRIWVDLRAGFSEQGLAKLIWGITGEKPGPKIAPTEVQIAVTRLCHGVKHLFGRERELARLDVAWHDPKTHVVSIVAWGGVGKTSLVFEWMTRQATPNWPGFERVFDWSFYTEGTREQGAASADSFIAAALDFFGGDEGRKLASSPASPWDKGAKLAQLVAQHRTLLVLDGLEPLQHPPGPLAGQLKDSALTALLKGLAAAKNTGLCIVTTRVGLTDLDPWTGKTVAYLGEHEQQTDKYPQLSKLSPSAGIKLLKTLGVRGARKEFELLVKDVKGHALTLNLLGHYVAEAHGGDIRKRYQVKFVEADNAIQGGHAFRVMDTYAKWFAAEGLDGQCSLAVLRLLGLFDRPADVGCLAALCKEPAISGLTEPLMNLTDAKWNLSVNRISACGLVSTNRSEPTVVLGSRPSSLDSHPLVRECFAKQLRGQNPKAWREGHRRLYEHLKAATPDKPQADLENLQPLYQAVAHACQAGMHREAFHAIYDERIRRGSQEFSTKTLGAFGADVCALAYFFDEPWTRVVNALAAKEQTVVLHAAAVCLRALGRLEEAHETIEVSLKSYKEQRDWKGATRAAILRGEIELTLGSVSKAVQRFKDAIWLADQQGDLDQQIESRTDLGHSLHLLGKRKKALLCFRDAERLHNSRTGGPRVLCAMPGFRFCSLLLDGAERELERRVLHRVSAILRLSKPCRAHIQQCREVERRARQIIAQAKKQRIVLHVALGELTLGRAILYRAMLAPKQIVNEQDLDEAAVQIDKGMDSLRRAGTSHHFSRGLVLRAWLHYFQDLLEQARHDLDEALENAELGHMQLFKADILLHCARFFRDKAALAKARLLITKCDYRRRKKELRDAEKAALRWQ